MPSFFVSGRFISSLISSLKYKLYNVSYILYMYCLLHYQSHQPYWGRKWEQMPIQLTSWQTNTWILAGLVGFHTSIPPPPPNQVTDIRQRQMVFKKNTFILFYCQNTCTGLKTRGDSSYSIQPRIHPLAEVNNIHWNKNNIYSLVRIKLNETYYV